MVLVYGPRISSGAVSPMIRASPSRTPVMMPENAVGSTTLTIVFHLGTPRAYDASRSSLGTSFSISSVERTTTGIISSTRARQTAKPTRWKPNVVTQTA